MFNPALTLVIVTLVTGPSLVQASPVIESTRVQLLVKDGDNVTLPCVITDLGHHKVVWRRGNEIISVMKKNALKKITDDPRLSPTVSSLALHRVVAPDSGVYSCEVFETPASPVLAQLSHNLTVQSSTKYGQTPIVLLHIYFSSLLVCIMYSLKVSLVS
ncbi:Immunoglobulin-like domain [Trinorchestia longiramus]|nr:Immunoglobulin-like domain [Trinorchestia longiramus]